MIKGWSVLKLAGNDGTVREIICKEIEFEPNSVKHKCNQP